MAPRALIASLAVFGVMLAGCGGGESSERDKIDSTLHDYFTAFARGDSAKACGLLAVRAQEAAARAARTTTCAAAFDRALKSPGVVRYRSRLGEAKVVEVKLNGNIATAKVQAIGQTTSVPLQKEGDAWKIESAAGAGGGG
jgi:hypothetical protein